MANLVLPFHFPPAGKADAALVEADFNALINYFTNLAPSPINPGTQYQLAYYATTGSTLSGLALITGSKALVSDIHGLPIASTATTTELQGLHLLTASRAIATDVSGILTTSAVTSTELGYLSGVTSAIQTQLGTKKAIATGNAYSFETTDVTGNLQETAVTASQAVATDANGLPTASSTTATELGYVHGVTSAIQTQLNTKADRALDNLTSPTAINQHLLSGSAGNLDLGSSSAYWRSAYFNNRLFMSDGYPINWNNFTPGGPEFWYGHLDAWDGGAGFFFVQNSGPTRIQGFNSAGISLVNADGTLQLNLNTSTHTILLNNPNGSKTSASFNFSTTAGTTRGQVWNVDNAALEDIVSSSQLATKASVAEAYVTIGNTSGLSAERALTGTSNQIVVTDNGANSTAVLSTPQNIHTAATPTFASETLTATSNQLVLGTTRTATITAPTPATSSRVYTFPDLTGDYSILATIGDQTATGIKTFSGQLIGKGTATNDSASAGYIGEYLESQVSTSTNTGANNVAFNAASLNLTAGDWDVCGIINYTKNGATFSSLSLYTAISTTSGNSFTGEVIGVNAAEIDLSLTNFANYTFVLPFQQISVATTTTYYLKGYVAQFSVGQPQYTCRFTARRRR